MEKSYATKRRGYPKFEPRVYFFGRLGLDMVIVLGGEGPQGGGKRIGLKRWNLLRGFGLGWLERGKKMNHVQFKGGFDIYRDWKEIDLIRNRAEFKKNKKEKRRGKELGAYALCQRRQIDTQTKASRCSTSLHSSGSTW